MNMASYKAAKVIKVVNCQIKFVVPLVRLFSKAIQKRVIYTLRGNLFSESARDKEKNSAITFNAAMNEIRVEIKECSGRA